MCCVGLDQKLHCVQIAMAKTWKLIRCHSPNQQVQGVCMQVVAKVKVNYKFSFYFSLWQTHILTFDQQLSHVAKCHSMAQKWVNNALVVLTSMRSLGHKGKLDTMQAWDVHAQADTIEQACEVVAYLYMHAQARAHLARYTKHFIHFDCSQCVLLEVSNRQALI